MNDHQHARVRILQALFDGAAIANTPDNRFALASLIVDGLVRYPDPNANPVLTEQGEDAALRLGPGAPT